MTPNLVKDKRFKPATECVSVTFGPAVVKAESRLIGRDADRPDIFGATAISTLRPASADRSTCGARIACGARPPSRHLN